MDGIGQSFAPHCLDMEIMHAVIFLRCKEVPAIDQMIVPGATFFVFFCVPVSAPHNPSEEFHFVVFKRAAEMSMHRNSWGRVRLSQEIERDLCLWEQMVPQIRGEIFGHAGKNTEEMCFEIANSYFRRAGPMTSRRN